MDEVLKRAIADLREEEALRATEEMLARGADPLHVIELSRLGMDEVGRRYERQEYYLSALIMSGEIFHEIVALVEGSFGLQAVGAQDPTVIMGAPLGDVHDIGKNVVCTLLRCSGFNVVDLGVSVAPSRFAQAAAEHAAALVGLSALITPAYESMRETVLCCERAGLRDRLKIMIGGGAVAAKVCEYTGADAWGRDAADAVRFAKSYTGKGEGK